MKIYRYLLILVALAQPSVPSFAGCPLNAQVYGKQIEADTRLLVHGHLEPIAELSNKDLAYIETELDRCRKFIHGERVGPIENHRMITIIKALALEAKASNDKSIALTVAQGDLGGHRKKLSEKQKSYSGQPLRLSKISRASSRSEAEVASVKFANRSASQQNHRESVKEVRSRAATDALVQSALRPSQHQAKESQPFNEAAPATFEAANAARKQSKVEQPLHEAVQPQPVKQAAPASKEVANAAVKQSTIEQPLHEAEQRPPANEAAPASTEAANAAVKQSTVEQPLHEAEQQPPANEAAPASTEAANAAVKQSTVEQPLHEAEQQPPANEAAPASAEIASAAQKKSTDEQPPQETKEQQAVNEAAAAKIEADTQADRDLPTECKPESFAKSKIIENLGPDRLKAIFSLVSTGQKQDACNQIDKFITFSDTAILLYNTCFGLTKASSDENIREYSSSVEAQALAVFKTGWISEDYKRSCGAIKEPHQSATVDSNADHR